jgi:hypothetical protein
MADDKCGDSTQSYDTIIDDGHPNITYSVGWDAPSHVSLTSGYFNDTMQYAFSSANPRSICLMQCFVCIHTVEQARQALVLPYHSRGTRSLSTEERLMTTQHSALH